MKSLPSGSSKKKKKKVQSSAIKGFINRNLSFCWNKLLLSTIPATGSSSSRKPSCRLIYSSLQPQRASAVETPLFAGIIYYYPQFQPQGAQQQKALLPLDIFISPATQDISSRNFSFYQNNLLLPIILATEGSSSGKPSCCWTYSSLQPQRASIVETPLIAGHIYFISNR